VPEPTYVDTSADEPASLPARPPLALAEADALRRSCTGLSACALVYAPNVIAKTRAAAATRARFTGARISQSRLA
jgi:hypothetical protein